MLEYQYIMLKYLQRQTYMHAMITYQTIILKYQHMHAIEQIEYSLKMSEKSEVSKYKVKV